MRTLALVVTLFLLVGCDGYKKDVETVCNVRSNVKIPPNSDNEDIIGGYLFEEHPLAQGEEGVPLARHDEQHREARALAQRGCGDRCLAVPARRRGRSRAQGSRCHAAARTSLLPLRHPKRPLTPAAEVASGR